MNQTGLIVAVLGLGAAAFLYLRSQQQQAAAVAAAQAAPGPGLVQKVENTAKTVAKGFASAPAAVTGTVKTGANIALGLGGRVTGAIGGAAGSVIHSIGGLF